MLAATGEDRGRCETSKCQYLREETPVEWVRRAIEDSEVSE